MSLTPRHKPCPARLWVVLAAAAASAASAARGGSTWPAAATAGCLLGLLLATRRERALVHASSATQAGAELAAAEAAPAPTEHRAANLFDATSAGVLVVDDQGIVRQGNVAAQRILGCDQLIGVPIARLLPTLSGTSPSAREHVALGTDGMPREVAVQVDPLPGATPEDKMLVLMDTSAVHEAERQLLVQNNLLQNASMALFDAKVSAEEDSRRKTQFLTYASHEIRTPLTAILGFAEQIHDKALSEDERDEAVRIIRRNSEHLLTVLSDVLDLAKIEADHLEVRYAACDLRATVREVVELFTANKRERSAHIVVDERTPLPPTVNTDATRLRQILINLLGNALRQPATNDAVRHARLRIELSCHAEPPEVRIEVIDQQGSRSAADLEALFEPFEKAVRCADPRSGSGLGLAISRRLARLLGGDVTARSAQDNGTTLAFTFHPGQLAPQPEWTQRTPSRGGAAEGDVPLRARVLLAEDGPDNQRLISTILRRAGAEVTVVADGARAIDAVAAATGPQRFDLIIMDMQMPVMDGYAATAELRAKGCQQPILALTANAFADARQRCLDAGCDDYASKPIDRRTLLATLRSLLQRGPARHQAMAAVE
jgi:signal transduction histidine kinase/AmiR/NasT family two-component response regulator